MFLAKHFLANVNRPCTKRSKLTCLPLSSFLGETLLFCQYGRGQCGKRHFKPCWAFKDHTKQKDVELKEKGR